MNLLKQKIITIFGAVSVLLGSIGAAIAGFGICPCTLVPILSIAGSISIVMGFLSDNKTYFIIVGIFLLSISFILYKKKRIGRLHKNG